MQSNQANEILEQAKSGDAAAQYALGQAYRDGDLGLDLDMKRAVDWLRKAAAKRHVNAQLELALVLLYEDEYRNPAEAADWLASAARHGNAEAMNVLGMLYQRGEGVPRDRDAALVLYRQAASRGYAAAYNNIGLYFTDADNPAYNPRAAVHHFRMAEEQGFEVASRNLNRLFAQLRSAGIDPVNMHDA